MITLYKNIQGNSVTPNLSIVWQDKVDVSQLICLTAEASEDIQKDILWQFGKASISCTQ